MKIKKVQAQRKFAQGVPIPQSTQTTNVDKANNTTIQKDPDIRRNVFHSSTSATGLLDVISFQNLHTHREPIVLLERLRKYPEKLQASSSAEVSRQQIEIQIPTALKHSMCLRSKKGVKRLSGKIHSILKNKQQPKLSNDASFESMESCTEDDQPLQFLSKDDKRNKKVDKTFYTTNRDKEKRVRFDIDDEPAESDSNEPQQKSGQHYSQPSTDSENNNTSECEPKQPDNNRSRLAQRRMSVAAQEFEQETPSKPIRRQRSRSMFRPEDVVKKPSLRTRSRQRSRSVAYASDSDDLESEDIISPPKIVKKPSLRTRSRQRSRSVAYASDSEDLESEDIISPPKIDVVKKPSLRTRSRQRSRSVAYASDSEDLESEDIISPPKIVKKPSLRTRSRQRSRSVAYASDSEDPESEDNISPPKIDETKNTNIYRKRLRSGSIDEAAKLRREAHIDRRVQTTDFEMISQPSTSGKKSAKTTETPISDNTMAKATVSSKKRSSSSTLCTEFLVHTALGMQPVVKIECPEASLNEAPTNPITKKTKNNSPKKKQELKSANSDGNTKLVSSHYTEHTLPSTSQERATVTEKDLTAPLLSRRTRNISNERVSKTNQQREITRKPRSTTEKHSGPAHTSTNFQKCQIYCPSKNYSNMNEIVYADIRDLVGRCKNCKYCAFVDKVLCVLSLFKIQDCRKMIKSKILEYDDEEGSVLCASESAVRPSNVYTTQRYYLVFEKHTDIVAEIKRDMLGNQLIKIKISVMPRSSQIRLTVVTVSDNERILDDIINHLLAKKSHIPVTPGANKSDLFQHRPSTSTANTFGNAQRTTRKFMSTGRQTDAPTFYPTEEEFTDPIAYFNRIIASASRYGICKVVAPQSFKPKCILNEDVRFGVTNQYIYRLFNRWGPAARELCAIKAHLASQGVIFSRPPLLDGVEVNLPTLYYLVQALGGLKEVIEKKRWSKIAEEMNLYKTPKIEVRLDQIYVKYILPYDTLRSFERNDLMETVDEYWEKKHEKMLERAKRPLPTQIDPVPPGDPVAEIQFEDVYVAGALSDSEDCITAGRQMNMITFKKVANRCKEMFMPGGKDYKTPNEIEQIYWKKVLHAQEHICINNASVDTGEGGHGFTKDQRDSYGKHPWNLKMLNQNSGNMLRFLGPILGVTIPTLHLGMVFSTSCWHRDPHNLPWIEYMHSGPGKIWYGIPNEQTGNFRRAVESLCPTSCQNKSIWLPSDMTMIPPDLLLENNVSMSRVVQEPGEFIIVLPRAYSSSIATGFTVTESVYFATFSWLQTIEQTFNQVRDNCEPTMFSLEHLLVSAARDENAPTSVHRLVNLLLRKIIREELKNRSTIATYKIPLQSKQRKRTRRRPAGAWNVRDQDECEFCQFTLFLSKVRGLRDERRSMCLKHALQFLETVKPDKRRLSGVEVELNISDVELKDLISKMGP